MWPFCMVTVAGKSVARGQYENESPINSKSPTFGLSRKKSHSLESPVSFCTIPISLPSSFRCAPVAYLSTEGYIEASLP